MAVTARIPRTISRIGYAMITSTDQSTGKDTYGPVKLLPHIAGGREFTADPQGDTYSVFADGLEIYAENNNSGYEIQLTTVAITDDVEEDWYARTITSDGVAEYATQEQAKAPEFALFILEETTDGIGKVTFFGKCHVSTRPSKSGKTKEDGAIDPQFPQHTIVARPRWDDGFVCKEIKSNVIPQTVPTVLAPALATLAITGVTLVPAFDAGIRNYTAGTTSATNVITATGADSATVVIKNGSTTVNSGSAATWSAGANTLTITATKGGITTTYTVTVTKS
jgi:phi13 family phage major tail protein